MIRTGLWLVGGVLLGAIIHLVVILAMPALATRDVWSNITELEATNRLVLLEAGEPGGANPLHLDPEMIYGICQLDLTRNPGRLRGLLPLGFWSVAVFDAKGTVLYSTTNRNGVGQALNLGIYNPAQIRLVAEQQIVIDEGLILVETAGNDVFAVVRLALPYRAVAERYRDALRALQCAEIK